MPLMKYVHDEVSEPLLPNGKKYRFLPGEYTEVDEEDIQYLGSDYRVKPGPKVANNLVLEDNEEMDTDTDTDGDE